MVWEKKEYLPLTPTETARTQEDFFAYGFLRKVGKKTPSGRRPATGEKKGKTRNGKIEKFRDIYSYVVL